MADIAEKIRLRTQAFVEEIVALVQEAIVQSVTGSLRGGGARRLHTPGEASPRPPRTPRRGTARRKGQKRPADEIASTVEQLRDYVRAHGGERIEQIAKGMGITTRELFLPMKKLVADGVVRTKGQRRATRYFAK